MRQTTLNTNTKYLFLTLVLTLIMLPLETIRAQQKNNSRINWLDSDSNVLILQNKVYPKAHTFCFDLAFGQQDMSRFQDTSVIQLKGSYYIWEDWGVELYYSIISNSNNTSFSSLQTLTTEQPFMRKITASMGGNLLYSPFYAKINIWNKIIYFNLVSGIGIALLETSSNFLQYMDMTAGTKLNSVYTQESMIGYNTKIEFKFYITKNILISPSVSNTFYSTKDAKVGAPEVIKNYQDYLLAIGLSI